MSAAEREFILKGIRCWIDAPADVTDGQPLPLVIVPAGENMAAAVAHAVAAAKTARCQPFVLAGFCAENWEQDFTPWPAPPLGKKGEAFGGQAGRTLTWMLEDFLPAVETAYPIYPNRDKRSILGYSLGGLFALWASYESRAFGGCASCSGSLWYDGWLDYAAGHTLPTNSRVYLSLGRAEENARNPRMAAVGEITRRYAQALAVDPQVAQTTLDWHDGGHFRDTGHRLTTALQWLL